MLTRWLLYPYAHTLYCTKYHKIPVNGYGEQISSMTDEELAQAILETANRAGCYG